MQDCFDQMYFVKSTKPFFANHFYKEKVISFTMEQWNFLMLHSG